MAAERAAADAGRQPHQLTPAWLFSRTQRLRAAPAE
jgi:hypothetical protein